MPSYGQVPSNQKQSLYSTLSGLTQEKAKFKLLVFKGNVSI